MGIGYIDSICGNKKKSNGNATEKGLVGEPAKFGFCSGLLLQGIIHFYRSILMFTRHSSSHNHGSVENGSVSKSSVLS